MTIEHFKARVFELAATKGFDDYELYYQHGTSLSLESFEQRINSYANSTTQGVNFRGVVAGKAGSCYTEVFDEAAANFIVEQAYQSAQLIENDDVISMVAPGRDYGELELYNSALEQVTSADKADLAIRTESSALAQSIINHVEGVSYSDASVDCRLYNSQGLDISYRRNVAYYYIFALSKGQSDTQSAFELAYDNDFQRLASVDIVSRASEVLTAKQGATSLPSGRYQVAFSGEALANLLAVFISNFSAERVQKGMSLFKGKLGQSVASSAVTLIDDPHLAGGMASAPFDGEGVPTYKKSLIENGRLMTFLHNINSAQKDGVQTTANASRASFKSTIGIAPSNAYLKPGERTVDQLYDEIDQGVLITELDGLHAGANPISGDFSLSARGFKIVAGKRSQAVKQIVVSGNFFTVLQQVVATADDLVFKTQPIGAPTTWLGELDIAGEDVS